jgi:hypothetical protein
MGNMGLLNSRFYKAGRMLTNECRNGLGNVRIIGIVSGRSANGGMRKVFLGGNQAGEAPSDRGNGCFLANSRGTSFLKKSYSGSAFWPKHRHAAACDIL